MSLVSTLISREEKIEEKKRCTHKEELIVHKDKRANELTRRNKSSLRFVLLITGVISIKSVINSARSCVELSHFIYELTKDLNCYSSSHGKKINWMV